LREPITPTQGDAVICLFCAHVAVYTKELTLREPTEAELVEINANPDVAAHRSAVNQYWFGDLKVKQ
jgi:hypothetical protein